MASIARRCFNRYMSDQQYTHLLRAIADMGDSVLAATKILIKESEERLEARLIAYIDLRFRQSDEMHHEAHQQILSAVADIIVPMQRQINMLASGRNEH